MKRKGITPVIAIVLLLMMTVAAAGLAFSWVTEVQTQAQAGIAQQITTQQQAAQSAVTIDSVWAENNSVDSLLNTTGKMDADDELYLAFTVKNAGSFSYTGGDVQNFKLYIDGKPKDPIVLNTANVTNGFAGYTEGDLDTGRSVEVYTNIDWHDVDGKTGETLVIRVVPPFGTEAIKACTLRTDPATWC